MLKAKFHKQSNYSSVGGSITRSQDDLQDLQKPIDKSAPLDKRSNILSQNRNKRYCLQSPRGFLIQTNGEIKFSLDCFSWSFSPNNATQYGTKEEAHAALEEIKSSFHSDENHLIELIGAKEFIFRYAGKNQWFTNDN
tara:strand:+ start:279 stop:692 length:414 start_codon:yes stop_codon:yes gene_type:complete